MAIQWKNIKMTSNTSPSPYKASADGEYGGQYHAYYAFTGYRKTAQPDCWASTTGTHRGWLQIDLGEITRLNAYSLSPRDVVSGGEYYRSAPRTWTLQGSNDGVNFNVVHSVLNETSWNTTTHNITYTLDDAHTYRYWRVVVTENNGNNIYTCIGQFKLGYDAEADKKLRMVIENTSNSKMYSIDTTTSTLIEIINATEQDIFTYGMKEDEEFNFTTLKLNKFKVITRDGDNTTEVNSVINISNIYDYLGANPNLVLSSQENKDIIVDVLSDEYLFYDEVNSLTVHYTTTTNTPLPKLNILANYSPIDELQGDINILSWQENDGQTLTTEIIKKNKSSIVTPLNDIITLGINKYNNFEIDATGDVRFAFSVDRGLTYYTFSNGTWNQANDASEGMSKDVVSLLKNDDIVALQGDSDYLRIQYSLHGELAKLDNIKMNVTFLDSEKLADTSKYGLEYDLLNKTINVDFKVAGTYSISYMDAK